MNLKQQVLYAAGIGAVVGLLSALSYIGICKLIGEEIETTSLAIFVSVTTAVVTTASLSKIARTAESA
ncbi:MAG: hypothetical protein EPO68_15660 [Planctomycetota bacterium]|nr:MAG: hypothetical protein EPO68_15660 [Planctomycetota bacterium]